MPVAIAFGAVQGHVELASEVRARAAEFAAAVYDEAERQEFSGDAVVTSEIPDWAPELESWLPVPQLATLGLRVADKPGGVLVATCGVDQHVDDFHGPVLCMVLHNDGLTFRQGRASHKTAAGEWFVFNDRANHEVREGPGRQVYVGWTVGLQPIA